MMILEHYLIPLKKKEIKKKIATKDKESTKQKKLINKERNVLEKVDKRKNTMMTLGQRGLEKVR
jgi:hypothetical protein